MVAIAAGDGHSLATRGGRQAHILIEHPASQCGGPGETNYFRVNSVGPNLSFQWQFNSVNISGGTNTRLTLKNVQSGSQGDYCVIVSNGAGSVTSQNAFLTFAAPPAILSKTPSSSNLSLLYGEPLSLSMNVTNVAACLTLTHNWTLNGGFPAPLVGSNHFVQGVKNKDACVYLVTAQNGAGTTNTSWTVDVAGEGHVSPGQRRFGLEPFAGRDEHGGAGGRREPRAGSAGDRPCPRLGQ